MSSWDDALALAKQQRVRAQAWSGMFWHCLLTWRPSPAGCSEMPRRCQLFQLVRVLTPLPPCSPPVFCRKWCSNSLGSS